MSREMEGDMFTAMTKAEAHVLADLLEANGVDEARVVENEYGHSVQIWVYGCGERNRCFVTLEAATLHKMGELEENEDPA